MSLDILNGQCRFCPARYSTAIERVRHEENGCRQRADVRDGKIRAVVAAQWATLCSFLQTFVYHGEYRTVDDGTPDGKLVFELIGHVRLSEWHAVHRIGALPCAVNVVDGLLAELF